MTFSTGPPDWPEVMAQLFVVAVVAISVVPFAHVVAELDPSNIDSVYIPHA